MGADPFDLARDCRTYRGTRAVVAHPPCRAWGRFAYKAKPRPDEKEVAIWCLSTVRMFGGVLEHPGHSGLFELARVAPGKRDAVGGWVLPILQSWFGHPAPKATWLYIVGIEPHEVPRLPLTLGLPPGRVENQSRKAREVTPPALAEWLVNLADLIEGKKR